MRASSAIPCLFLVATLFLACGPAQTTPCVAQELKSADLAGGKTLPAGSCYLVKTNLSLSNGTLVAEKGVLISFSTDVGLSVTGAGRLKINGTSDAPVRFTGADPAVKWKGVRLDDSQGADNTWAWFEISNAGSEKWTGAAWSSAALFLDGSSGVVADHLTVRSSASHGLLMTAAVTNTFTNLTLAGNLTPAYVHPQVVDQLPADTTFEANTTPSVRVVFGNNDGVEGTHTWPAFTYQMEDRSFVKGALTLAPGATLKFAQNASLVVETAATLTAQGTAAAPITFTRADTGLWKGLSVGGGSAGAPSVRLAFCVIEYAAGENWSGNAESKAALYLEAAAAAQVTDTTFRNNERYAVWASGRAALPGFGRNTFTDNGRVMLLHPDRVGDLGVGNTFTGNTINGLHLVSGNNDAVTAPATWKDQGVPLLVRDRFFVNAALQLDPGVTLQFAQNASLEVATTGSLSANGTATAKVTFEGQSADAAGFWKGLRFQSNLPANVLTQTIVRHAGSARWTGDSESDAALYLDASAQLTLSNVTVGPNGGYGVFREAASSNLTCTAAAFSSNVKGAVYDDDNAVTVPGC